ncbi:MAG TPA: CHAP domain-containing protein [Spirochaetia bacterium]|nr:CHAP domain-containing protein [Spirochaetia bacterium]
MSLLLSAGRRTAKSTVPAVVVILATLMFSGACATTQPNGYGWPAVYHPSRLAQPAPPRASEDPSVVALRAKLVQGANAVLGRTELSIRGRRFTMDCTGTVLAIYWYAGIDLSRDFPKLKGSGVSRIYQTLRRRDLLYTTVHPLSGDIIFWDNTYDEGGYDGWDNPLSHTGMVVSIDPEGTIAYVHYHIRRGITIDYMNLENPNVQSRMENGSLKVINSPLRLAVPGRPHPARWLAGQLYRELGLGYLLQ